MTKMAMRSSVTRFRSCWFATTNALSMIPRITSGRTRPNRLLTVTMTPAAASRCQYGLTKTSSRR